MRRAFDRHWLAPLERHRERRRQGVPTVTVMVGAPGAAEWIWKQWHSDDEAPPVLVACAEHLTARWLEQASVLERLTDVVQREVARLEGIPPSELKSLLAGRSRGQLEDLAVRRAAQLELDETWLLCGLGVSRGDRRMELRRRGVVARLASLIGALPPLLVRPAASAPGLVDLAQRLFEISEEAPGVALGLALDESAISELRVAAPARLLSALTEGLITLRPRRGGNGNDAPGSLHYDEETFARSRAERTLYDELQGRARTRGLFALNQRIEADSRMEVDLLCETLKLAIEIDGYHHFRDADGYRRDRRKDVRLQELGYLVLRVLATDVDSELAHVLENIDRAVGERRRRIG